MKVGEVLRGGEHDVDGGVVPESLRRRRGMRKQGALERAGERLCEGILSQEKLPKGRHLRKRRGADLLENLGAHYRLPEVGIVCQAVANGCERQESGAAGFKATTLVQQRRRGSAHDGRQVNRSRQAPAFVDGPPSSVPQVLCHLRSEKQRYCTCVLHDKKQGPDAVARQNTSLCPEARAFAAASANIFWPSSCSCSTISTKGEKSSADSNFVANKPILSSSSDEEQT